MTWTADRTAFRNVGRAMRAPQVREFIRESGMAGSVIVPAVSTDRMSDISTQFDEDSGVIIVTREDDVVDVLIVRESVPASLAHIGEMTVGQLLEAIDAAERSARPAVPPHRRFSLAA